MRLLLAVLTAAVTAAALASPAGARAQLPGLPCVDAIVATVNCDDAAAAPTAERCPGRELVPTAHNVTAVRRATLCLVNDARAEHGLERLRSVGTLQTVAAAYARRMVREGFFEHVSPDGGTFISRIKRTAYLRGGLRRWSVGENIAWGTGRLAAPEEIVRAWMASPGHRRNILNASFTEFGLGIATGAPARLKSANPAATYVNAFGQRRR